MSIVIFEGGRRRQLALAAALVGCALAASGLAHAGTAKSRALSASGQLKRTEKPGPLSAVQEGTISGKPFGSAKMVLRSTLKQAKVSSTFTVSTKSGRATGRATARLTLDGDTATYTGTATITGGTGRYERITGSKITFSGTGPVSGKSVKISLSGTVRY